MLTATLFVLLATSVWFVDVTSAQDDGGDPLRLMLFTETRGFTHDSISDAVELFTAISEENNWDVFHVPDSQGQFTSETLESVDVIMFLSTTGDVLDTDEQAAFESWFQSGGKGYVGVHSATDTEYDWEFYETVVGAYFDFHPASQLADLRIIDGDNVRMWRRCDEWYDFRTDVTGLPNMTVHVTIDEGSYEGSRMGAGDQHPMIWSRQLGNSRTFYSALSHTSITFTEPDEDFVAIMEIAMDYAGFRLDSVDLTSIEPNVSSPFPCSAGSRPPLPTMFDGSGSTSFLRRNSSPVFLGLMTLVVSRVQW